MIVLGGGGGDQWYCDVAGIIFSGMLACLLKSKDTIVIKSDKIV